MKEFVAANLEVAAIETAPVAAESVKENSVTAGDSKTSMNTTQPTAAIKELKGEMEVFEILWNAPA